MKTKILQLVLWLLIGTTPSMAQSNERKAEKERKRVEAEKATVTLIESKNFEFRATRALPTGYKSMDLTTNPNFVRFSEELIKSEMPFFGKAYSVPFGGDGGLKFEGKPEQYTIEKGKKNYSVVAKVKGSNDFYTIHLTVSLDGGATMDISSNNRSSISYFGSIAPLVHPADKK